MSKSSLPIKAVNPKPSRSSDPSGSSSAALLERIQKLESALLGSTSDPNPLLELVALARNGSPEVVHKAIWALHRVFIKLIREDRVGGLSESGARSAVNGDEEEAGRRIGDEKREAREVKAWVRDRLVEYVEVLGGLLRDSEAALRTSAVPLLFSLLPPLSASVSLPDYPIIHIPYFRILLRSLLFPSDSLRGASRREPSSSSSSSSNEATRVWTVVGRNQIDAPEGTLPADVVELVTDEFWAKYDDIRWAFFREATQILESAPAPSPHPENLLSQLLPLTNLPRVQEDLNAFFIPSFASTPSSLAPLSKKAKLGQSEGKSASARKNRKGKGKGKDSGVDALPDWMAYYESSEEEEDVKTGKKRSASGRSAQLSVHASIHSVVSHQNMYTGLWEAVLGGVALDEGWTRKILVGLHGSKGILGHMKPERRVRVADWLGSLVDRGGAEAMLAMNGLFVLMTQYNLDYPNFYQRLYALLDANVLHVRYRARFFRLIDTFLRSALLPASLVASFIKRLSRLALTGPPAGVIMVIPFVYNLFKRHPGCMVMLQRLDDGDGEYNDPYDAIETSPTSTRAIDSSCWELASLQNHYLASVSTLAKIFSETFTKPEFNLEDFLDHGYGTLFETEMNRKIKYAPALAMSLETEGAGGAAVGDAIVFPGKQVGEEQRAGADVVGQLWAF